MAHLEHVRDFRVVLATDDLETGHARFPDRAAAARNVEPCGVHRSAIAGDATPAPRVRDSARANNLDLNQRVRCTSFGKAAALNDRQLVATSNPNRMAMNAPDRAPLRLTEFSHGGGCGCKIAPAVLRQILGTAGTSGLPIPKALLVGIETSDDAAVFQLNDRQAIVATTDFFMPIVDDPFDFGRIAATNAISDVYAMGGQPLFALALVGMPTSASAMIGLPPIA